MTTLKNVRYRGTRGGGMRLSGDPDPAGLRAQADAADKAAAALDRDALQKRQQASVMRANRLDGGANDVEQQANAATRKAAAAREQASALREQANTLTDKPTSAVGPAGVLVGLGLLWWAFGPRG